VLRVDSSWNVVSSGGTQLTTDAELEFYLNMAAYEWCKTAFKLEGTATKTWATTAARYQLHELTPASVQGNLHSVEVVTKTVSSVTTRLEKYSYAALRTHYPDHLTASAAPIVWAVEQSNLYLGAKPASETTMTFYGPCYPEKLGGAVTSWAWMEDTDLLAVIPTLAAMMMIRRKFSDPNLYGRFEELALQYNEAYTTYRARLDQETAREHFNAIAPDMMPQGKR
jgi:hypothetical protein